MTNNTGDDQTLTDAESESLWLCECGHDSSGEHNGLGCYGRISYDPLVKCECKRTDADHERSVEKAVERILAARADKDAAAVRALADEGYWLVRFYGDICQTCHTQGSAQSISIPAALTADSTPLTLTVTAGDEPVSALGMVEALDRAADSKLQED